MATDPPPKRHSLAVVDAAGFTQSELLSLSRCSHSALDQRDVVIPEIDRSIFNESAATWRQTYSEIRPCNRRKRRSETSPMREVRAESGDSEGDENRLIVRLLKDLIKTSPLHDPAEEERMKWFGEEMVDCDGRGGDGKTTKKKRGRRAEKEVFDDEIVNMNGVVVDLVELENVLDPYGEELKRRTAGLVSEEDCLGFLRGLEGEWVSKRRKRRIVDACEFGDHLPVRWKLLLALRRREGRIWLYCRRYISPGGQEFVSCKDVALYLQSIFGVSIHPVVDVKMDSIHNNVGTLLKKGSLGNRNVPVAALRTSSVYGEQGSEFDLQGIEKLVDIQVSSFFDCHQCKLVFLEKKLFLQHVLSSHEKTTRRYRLGSRVSNGVILDNGQYECQFCSRIFREKDSYRSHVGVHVRGNSNVWLDRTCADAELITLSNSGLLKPFSKGGDTLFINVPNHLLDSSTTVDNNEYHGGLTLTKPNVAASDGNSCHELVSKSHAAPEIEYSIFRDEILKLVSENQDIEKDFGNQLRFEGNSIFVSDICSDNSKIAYPLGNVVSLTEDFKQPAAQHSRVPESHLQDPNGNYEKCAHETVSPACVANSEHPTSVWKETEYKGSNLQYGGQTGNELKTNTDTHMKQNLEQNVITSGEIESSGDFGKSGLMVQPSDHLTEFSSTPCEEEELSSFRQKLEHVAEFELEYSVQPVNELETNTDTQMKQNLERNVMTSGEIVSSGDFCKSGLMVQPLDHLTEFSSTPCEGEELSSFRQKLESEIELEYNVQPVNELEMETNTETCMKQSLEQNVMTSGEIVSSGDFGKSGSMVEPSDHLTELSSTPCEGEELSSFRQKLESVSEFEELKLDDIEPLTFSFLIREESLPTPVAPMDIVNDAEMNAFDSTQVAVEDILCSMECRCQITAVCVWCNSEFIHEVVDSELQADSVGYMCTTCRAKISAQFSAPTMVLP